MHRKYTIDNRNNKFYFKESTSTATLRTAIIPIGVYTNTYYESGFINLNVHIKQQPYPIQHLIFQVLNQLVLYFLYQTEIVRIC